MHCMPKSPRVRLHASLRSTNLLLLNHHLWILRNAFLCSSLVEFSVLGRAFSLDEFILVTNLSRGKTPAFLMIHAIQGTL